MTRSSPGPVLGIGAIAALALGLAACGSSAGVEPAGASGGVGTFGSLMAFGSTSPPPVAPEGPIEVAECPPVTVAEGAAAIRSGEGAAVRSQVSISEVARECTGRADGTVMLKVGLQLRALLGPGSGAGRFDTPVSILVKRGEQVVASRSRRVAIAIPPGQAEASTVIVEDGIAVPPGTGEFDIEIALGGRAAEPTRRRTRG